MQCLLGGRTTTESIYTADLSGWIPQSQTSCQGLIMTARFYPVTIHYKNPQAQLRLKEIASNGVCSSVCLSFYAVAGWPREFCLSNDIQSMCLPVCLPDSLSSRMSRLFLPRTASGPILHGENGQMLENAVSRKSYIQRSPSFLWHASPYIWSPLHFYNTHHLMFEKYLKNSSWMNQNFARNGQCAPIWRNGT